MVTYAETQYKNYHKRILNEINTINMNIHKLSHRLRRLFRHLTFIGVVIHEIAHIYVCKAYNIPITGYKLYDMDICGGYVEHYITKSYMPMFFVAVAPFFFNIIVATMILLTIFTFQNQIFDYITTQPNYSSSILAVSVIFGLWASVSMLLHAFPSKQDANMLWNHTKRVTDESMKYYLIFPVVYPIVLFIYLLNKTRKVYANVIFTVFIVYTVYEFDIYKFITDVISPTL